MTAAELFDDHLARLEEAKAGASGPFVSVLDMLLEEVLRQGEQEFGVKPGQGHGPERVRALRLAIAASEATIRAGRRSQNTTLN